MANAGNPLADDPGWTDVLARLLAKIPIPEVFKHLRPIALLNANAKVWPRLVSGTLQPLDEEENPGAMGFKKQYSVSELVLDFRLLRDRTLEWGGDFGTAQLGFAAADLCCRRPLTEA